jgi:hypothetical protein
MQLADVICYLIRKGKEADKKLLAAWTEHKQEQNIEFKDWKEKSGNRGQKYFSNIYSRINSHKRWLFSKDFPS